MALVLSTSYLCNQRPQMPPEAEIWPERVITVLSIDTGFEPGASGWRASVLLLGYGFYIVVHYLISNKHLSKPRESHGV